MKIDRSQDIQAAVESSNLPGYTGNYKALGGGEVNDTFLLDLGEAKAVLRIAKDKGQRTLGSEAEALHKLTLDAVPKLLYYDDNNLINGKQWILESYLPGSSLDRLNLTQFQNLGVLLAQVHGSVTFDQTGVNAWEIFLDSCKNFGDEIILLNHPDPRLKNLLQRSRPCFEACQPKLDVVAPCLIHSDATPSNILVSGNSVSLIDWEFAKVSDPMAEFSTIYYDDMEYNKGKWRIKIQDNERAALFEGYRQGGGIVDEQRIQFWMIVDKLGAAVFLYWRLHESSRITSAEQTEQYKLDLNNLLESLEKHLA